ncbi:C-type lectin mannose-binding isoform-like [Physella acuta]|uniref:C-type lectin mannose-binding isoform-like n=1 Tax=Physella acuta TaxID=109671 RepID=UPI0027DC637B|nr:C-type lectin mannose-binding isoform-like [Physella acuta]
MINTMKLSAVCLLLYITQVDFSQVSAMCFSPTAFKLSNKCFEVFDTPMTWLEAEKTCFTFTERRSLAKVSTMNELSFLNFLKPNGYKEMWLGANDPTHDGKWVWQDGTIANLSSLWSPNEPNNADGDEYCLEIFRDGKLNDESCDRLRPFVCMELTAKLKCDKRTEKICDDGECIPDSYWCDGAMDCMDESDEYHCSIMYTNCRYNEFQCSLPVHDAQCIHLSWLCDGEMDCQDGSDEVNCKFIKVVLT